MGWRETEFVFSNNQLVGLGRPILYGLAAAGVDGVRDVIQEITSELLRLMSMTGAQDPWHVSRDLFDQGMTASPSARII
ncbi:MAG: alpha-hydroxy-acid oxidizing protein [Deltaproteobacteria bacterium]|nr:alpha-hydroxy-acid oxidizing protein [Deltaproteobacteria bacterium]